MKNYFVYMLASDNHNALYTGVTSDLEKRLYEHKNGIGHGYTKKYNCKNLVHYEIFSDPENAILREKEIKGWVRKRKNELIDKHNPSWQNLDPSVQALQDDVKGGKRYARQLALPEITPAHQQRLKQTHILIVGAGGLGAAALPLLAGAGIGHITIMDHDAIDETNLHRQTIFRTDQIGQNKAECAAAYLRALNPETEVIAIAQKLTRSVILKTFRSEGSHAAPTDPPAQSPHAKASEDRALQDDKNAYDLLLDGTDNFETKSLLNKIAIETETPLISTSVNQWQAQCGIFAGHAASQPCYHCLFPELPANARNCNEAGILGSTAALAGAYQAHLALGHLLGLESFTPGLILSMDFKTLRLSQMRLNKEERCAHCANGNKEWKDNAMNENQIPLIPPGQCRDDATLIVDVRTAGEIAGDPIEGALHIEVSQIPARYTELPKDKRLAFACASNIRSAQAAAFVQAMGYENVVIYDRKAG